MSLTVNDTREQLMARKIEIDEKLSALRIDIDEAKGTAWAKGRYLPPAEFANMRRELARLQRESQRLQFQLRGDRKQAHALKDQKGALFLQEFFLVARLRLSKEQFDALSKETASRLDQQSRTNN